MGKCKHPWLFFLIDFGWTGSKSKNTRLGVPDECFVDQPSFQNREFSHHLPMILCCSGASVPSVFLVSQLPMSWCRITPSKPANQHGSAPKKEWGKVAPSYTANPPLGYIQSQAAQHKKAFNPIRPAEPARLGASELDSLLAQHGQHKWLPPFEMQGQILISLNPKQLQRSRKVAW